MSFDGTWNIVSSPDFDDDYLHMVKAPCIELRQKGGRVTGDYSMGVQTGSIDGRIQGDQQMLFSFEGMDEMDEVDGAGTATLDGDHLTFTLMYHESDDYTFECERRK